jgi:hypothetical protein
MNPAGGFNEFSKTRTSQFWEAQQLQERLVVEQRTHHQITGEPMKFLTLADWTGTVEIELFTQHKCKDKPALKPTARHMLAARRGSPLVHFRMALAPAI